MNNINKVFSFIWSPDYANFQIPIKSCESNAYSCFADWSNYRRWSNAIESRSNIQGYLRISKFLLLQYEHDFFNKNMISCFLPLLFFYYSIFHHDIYLVVSSM